MTPDDEDRGRLESMVGSTGYHNGKVQSAGNGGTASVPFALVAQEMLRRALKHGPVPMRELEQQLQEMGLLAPDEGLTHSRRWQAARKAVGVTSVKRGAAWFWQLATPGADQVSEDLPLEGEPAADAPAPMRSSGSSKARGLDPESEPTGAGAVLAKPEPAIATPAVPVLLVAELRPLPERPLSRIVEVHEPPPSFESPGDLLPEWVRRVSKLDRRRVPPGIPRERWILYVDDCGTLLGSEVSTRAARLGWSTNDLFAIARVKPMENRHLAGLCWGLEHARVVEIFTDMANCMRGVTEFVLDRRRAPEASVVLPW